MSSSLITKETLGFLKALKKNNTREWFAANKSKYQNAHTTAKAFYLDLKEELNKHDEIDKHKLFRIYRDVRFSADKTPYKPHFAGSYSRAGASRRGGYYLRIRPGESFIAGGFWEPNKEDLLRIRKELEMDATEFRKVIGKGEFKKVWGELTGDEVKTAPKGFDRNHPDIDLIRKKGFIFVRNFTDQEVASSDFLQVVNESFKAIRPYFDFMSDILTTNLNGESLLD
ncbi:MAG: DUF2461 domain-containing protein [Eudoraea sp.]|nr:DUF2461 domain-containing protein [Eudoraea sp.]